MNHTVEALSLLLKDNETFNFTILIRQEGQESLNTVNNWQDVDRD
jgi:hypothetical protein